VSTRFTEGFTSSRLCKEQTKYVYSSDTLANTESYGNTYKYYGRVIKASNNIEGLSTCQDGSHSAN